MPKLVPLLGMPLSAIPCPVPATLQFLKDCLFLIRIYYVSLRILLQHRKSHLFLRGEDDWTPDVDAAKNFQQIVHAIDYVNTARLVDLEILMHFEDSRYDVRLSASPEADGRKNEST